MIMITTYILSMKCYYLLSHMDMMIFYIFLVIIFRDATLKNNNYGILSLTSENTNTLF